MIRYYAEKIKFPEDAIEEFSAIYQKVTQNPDWNRLFEKAKTRLLNERGRGFIDDLEALSQQAEIPRRPLDMTLLLAAAAPMKERFDARGIAEEIFWDSLEDLRYKLMENQANYGCWGTFVTFWFQEFYWCERFKLGRLQYEKRPFKCAEYGTVKQGDEVFNCHIPSSGPLTAEEVLASLKKAHTFYKAELKDGILPVVCRSWLLYPPFEGSVFPEHTNLFNFSRLFTKLILKEDPENDDFWRIFDQEYDPNTLKDAPDDTGLRRRLKDYLLQGNTMGSAYGILLFDGEKILSPKAYKL